MKLNRPATGLALAAVALLPGLAACGPAPLSCTASVSNATPKDYSRVFVYVHSWANTGFNTTALYKTTNSVKLGVTNTLGNDIVYYNISTATPGYRVNVVVRVAKNSQQATCYTSFTPHL